MINHPPRSTMAALDADEAMSDKANELAEWLRNQHNIFGTHKEQFDAAAAELTRLAEQKRQDDYAYKELFALAQQKDREIERLRAALGAKDKGER